MKRDANNPAQYCSEYGSYGEMHMNMTKAGSMGGVSKSQSRNDIRSGDRLSARTERFANVVPSKQAYSTLSKSGYKSMPNNNGSMVAEGIYKPGGKR